MPAVAGGGAGRGVLGLCVGVAVCVFVGWGVLKVCGSRPACCRDHFNIHVFHNNNSVHLGIFKL